MKRKAAFGVLALVLGAIAFLGYRVYRGAAAQRAVAERTATLPVFEAATLEGESFRRSDLPGGEPVVLIYFRTTCPYCKAEIRSIKAHDVLQQATPVLLVSAEGNAMLKQFKAAYQLGREPRLRVLRDRRGQVAKTFGISRVPQTFIYNAEGQLLHHFEGEAGAGSSSARRGTSITASSGVSTDRSCACRSRFSSAERRTTSSRA